MVGCCLYPGLSPALCGYTCSTLLAPSCGRILKLVNLWFLQLTKLAAGNLSLVLQKVALQLKFVVSLTPTDAGLISEGLPVYQRSLSLPHLRGHTRGQPQAGGRCGFRTQGIGVSMLRVGGSSGEVLPVAKWQASCWGPESCQQEPHSFNTL